MIWKWRGKSRNYNLGQIKPEIHFYFVTCFVYFTPLHTLVTIFLFWIKTYIFSLYAEVKYWYLFFIPILKDFQVCYKATGWEWEVPSHQFYQFNFLIPTYIQVWGAGFCLGALLPSQDPLSNEQSVISNNQIYRVISALDLLPLFSLNSPQHSQSKQEVEGSHCHQQWRGSKLKTSEPKRQTHYHLNNPVLPQWPWFYFLCQWTRAL